jgi:hypothetical protein
MSSSPSPRCLSLRSTQPPSPLQVDRTKFTYYTEESDAIDLTAKAEVADARSKGKKRDVISIFQSKSALKSKVTALTFD